MTYFTEKRYLVQLSENDFDPCVVRDEELVTHNDGNV